VYFLCVSLVCSNVLEPLTAEPDGVMQTCIAFDSFVRPRLSQVEVGLALATVIRSAAN
jgi:hypothetical protein